MAFNELLAIQNPQQGLRVQKWSMSVRQCAEKRKTDSAKPKIKKVQRQRVGWPPFCGHYQEVNLPLDKSFQAWQNAKRSWKPWMKACEDAVNVLLSRCV